MSDLFYTGKAKKTGKGSMGVSCKGAPDIVKKLQKLENGGKVAIQRTVSDFTTRAPAWVSQGIREHYGVDTAAIKDAATKPKRGKTTIKVAGIDVDGATLKYSGRLLTPTHFKMTPKKRPAAKQNTKIRIPGQAKAGAPPVAMVQPPKKYAIKATIIKGEGATLPSGAFLGRASKDENAKVIPWQRVGDGRLPVHVIKTLSVPQMIDGRARQTIEELISEGLGKRFEHHIQQAIK